MHMHMHMHTTQLYPPLSQNFSVSRFCVSCLCPFLFNICFCYINDFANRLWRYRNIVVILVGLPYAWRGMGMVDRPIGKPTSIALIISALLPRMYSGG